MKIKSVTDIITNSSSECYTVKTNLSKEEVRRMWTSKLKDWFKSGKDSYYSPDSWNHILEINDDSILGEVSSIASGEIGVDYPVLCNLDNAYELLCELFGKDNVIDDGEYARGGW